MSKQSKSNEEQLLKIERKKYWDFINRCAEDIRSWPWWRINDLSTGSPKASRSNIFKKKTKRGDVRCE